MSQFLFSAFGVNRKFNAIPVSTEGGHVQVQRRSKELEGELKSQNPTKKEMKCPLLHDSVFVYCISQYKRKLKLNANQ